MAREVLVGTITSPSGSIILVDPATLDDRGDEGRGDGSAVIDGLPTEGAIQVFATPDDAGRPWIESLRFEVRAEANGEEEAISAVTPAVHELLVMDVDATDRFSTSESRDGSFDVMFWGPDATVAARRLGLLSYEEVY